MTREILRCTEWRTNADLIADMHALGYIGDDDYTLDPTYGKGNWWTAWKPAELVAHDLKLDGVDFRRLPEPENTFDVVAFDPPYIAPGTRSKSTIPGFNDAYGVDHCPRTAPELHRMICDGLAEIRRVVKPGGIVLVKCMNYVTGGKYLPAAYMILDYAQTAGFVLVDEAVHVGKPGPQDKACRSCRGRGDVACTNCGSTGIQPQRTLRANHSMLFVLRAPKETP